MSNAPHRTDDAERVTTQRIVIMAGLENVDKKRLVSLQKEQKTIEAAKASVRNATNMLKERIQQKIFEALETSRRPSRSAREMAVLDWEEGVFVGRLAAVEVT